MKKTDPPIIVEHTFGVSVDKVWDALTRTDQMHKWYFKQMQSFKAEIGFETQFTIENEGRSFTHVWKVTELSPGKKIKTNWRFEEYAGDSYVSFELSEKGKQTKLKVLVEVTADFQDGIPEFTRESCIGGWNYFIKESLQDFLFGTKKYCLNHNATNVF